MKVARLPRKGIVRNKMPKVPSRTKGTHVDVILR